jgi:hypothetical protein
MGLPAGRTLAAIESDFWDVLMDIRKEARRRVPLVDDFIPLAERLLGEWRAGASGVAPEEVVEADVVRLRSELDEARDGERPPKVPWVSNSSIEQESAARRARASDALSQTSEPSATIKVVVDHKGNVIGVGDNVTPAAGDQPIQLRGNG